jgi:DNA-directed RNA polymerase I subunit RPA1
MLETGRAVGLGRKKKMLKSFAVPHFAFEDLLRKPNSTSHRQRFLLLSELQFTMATFARPVASSIAGVEFTVYSDEEIKKLSVKRIHNTPTLDSFNNPVPGGLYDPAMGAWGDHVYVIIHIP